MVEGARVAGPASVATPAAPPRVGLTTGAARPAVGGAAPAPMAQLSAAYVLGLQSGAGNGAVQRLLTGRGGPAPVAQRAKQKQRREALKSAPMHLADGRQKRREREATARAARRGELVDRKRSPREPNPVHEFDVVDAETGFHDHHRIFARSGAGGAPQLWIASYPLPVATFILEMAARYDSLITESQTGGRKMTRITAPQALFANALATAQAMLVAADLVFAEVTSTAEAKRKSERNLATALDPLILKVIQLAKRVGTHFSVIGNASATTLAKIMNPGMGIPDTGYYLKAVSGAAERYRIEGAVAKYQDLLPSYEGTGFERDHQPHNDLIERMSLLPEFAGRKLQDVAAGRTLKGWAIMLQHGRHMAGRTYGLKGGTVTGAFATDLAAFRGANLGATPAQIRAFGIDYLVLSMRADAAAMVTVANDDASYADMDPMPPGDKAAKRLEVRAQILAGEQRILATEDSIRTYDQLI